MVKLNGMLIAWQSKKQGAVALSTAEAELLLGVRQLCAEIGLQVRLPMRMSMDNQAAIKQVSSEISSAQAKHVDVRLKFMRDLQAKGLLLPTYLCARDMEADILTKPLAVSRVQELRDMIGLV